MTRSKKQQNLRASILLDALDKYFPRGMYATFRELWVENIETIDLKTSSFSRIDYYAMPYFNSRSPRKEVAGSYYAIEVKVDRSDFLKELRKPQKQRWALMYSNLFYYCVPKGLIEKRELPPYSGLLEFEKGILTQLVPPPWRDAFPPRWTFVSSLIRSISFQNGWPSGPATAANSSNMGAHSQQDKKIIAINSPLVKTKNDN